MSAGFRKYDVIETRKDLGLSWHGLDVLKENLSFDGSCLDFNAVELPVSFEYKGAYGKIGDMKAIYNERRNLYICTASKTYGLIQHRALWEAVAKGLEGTPYKINSIFTLDNLCKGAISLDIGQHGSVAKDEYKDTITILNSFDGSYNACAFDCNTRAVCANTIAVGYAERHAINLKIRHTRFAALAVDNMGQAIAELMANRKAFYADLNAIAARPIDLQTAGNLLNGWLANGVDLSTRAHNTAEMIYSLFCGSAVETNARQSASIAIDGTTRYGLLNAVTQYYTRHSAATANGLVTNRNAAQVSQSEFGTGAKRKAEFYRIMMDDAEIEKLAAKGAALLEKREIAMCN